MQRNKYLMIVVGAGGLNGSSTFYHACKIESEKYVRERALYSPPRILGIDQFPVNHTKGSSHGESRITRVATGEGPEYIQLAQRSHELWGEIEAKTGNRICNLVGGLIIGSDREVGNYHGSEVGFLRQTRKCANQFDIPHENLDSKELRRRFPQFKVEDHESGYFESETMGFINPDLAVKSQLQLAKEYGGELKTGEAALSFSKLPNGWVQVETEDAKGKKHEYLTKKLVLAAGSWTPQLLGSKYTPELKVYRQTVYWFEIEPSARAQYAIKKFPPFIWDGGKKKGIVYGFPIMEGKSYIKIGSEQFVETTSPEGVNRAVSEAEISEMYEKFIARNFVGITNKCVKTTVCLYTVAPKHRFVIDFVPGSEGSIIVLSACSGHAAKHSAALGQAVAQSCLLGTADIDVFNIFGGLHVKQGEPDVNLRAKL